GARVPDARCAAVWRACAKDPDHRKATLEECATAAWPEQPVAAPTKSRGAPRPLPKTAAEAPTQITGAPTTPLPATGAKRRPKRSRAGLVIGGVVVAVAGVGGYLARERGAEPAAGVAVGAERTPDSVRRPAR